MMTLFTESYEKMLKFIFNLYDFDKDSYVSKEDIRVVLSYIPLNTQTKVNSNTLKYEKYGI
jgi:Ca2+-binding EF-hand superfamily protein